MSFTLWAACYLFTLGLITDENDKWYDIALGFFVWPLILGAFVRKVLER